MYKKILVTLSLFFTLFSEAYALVDLEGAKGLQAEIVEIRQVQDQYSNYVLVHLSERGLTTVRINLNVSDWAEGDQIMIIYPWCANLVEIGRNGRKVYFHSLYEVKNLDKNSSGQIREPLTLYIPLNDDD